MRGRSISIAGFATLVAFAQVGSAQAQSAAQALAAAREELSALSKGWDAPPPPGANPGPPSPARRLAAAELLLRTRDYSRAITQLNLVLELQRQGTVDVNTYADALFLLGESYFNDNQLWAAKRQLRVIIERAPAVPFLAYAGRALARLVDIAVHTQDTAALDPLLEKVNRLPADASGSVDYARAKVHQARRDPDRARQAVERIRPSSQYFPQAQYLLGVIELNQALAIKESEGLAKKPNSGVVPLQLVRAVTQFQRVTRLKVSSPEHRHVMDLAWLALGRIFYDTDNPLDAADAYNRVYGHSPELQAQLDELTQVYLSLEDTERALQLLQVMDLGARDTLARAETGLLRGDLLLQAREHDQAEDAYQEVRGAYGPALQRVQAFLENNQDPAQYYDALVDDHGGVHSLAALPIGVTQWARELAQDNPVFTLVQDDAECRALLGESEQLVQQLLGALASSARVRTLPTERAELERWLGLHNRIARVRWWLARSLDAADDSLASGELGQLQAARRALMPRIARLPRTAVDFALREDQGEQQWAKVSQAVQRATHEVDRLQALSNGLKRLLSEQSQALGEATVVRLQSEVAASERAVEAYRERIGEYRRAVARGRVQFGLGDKRYVGDDAAREQFSRVLQAEVEAVLRQGASAAHQQAARGALEVLQQVTASEQALQAHKDRVSAQVELQTGVVRAAVLAEEARLKVHTAELARLEQQAREWVGAEAQAAVFSVRDQLQSIVLRSDTALVHQGWIQREHEQQKLVELQSSRALEERQINEERAETLDLRDETP